jgi:Uma2 family endonuclease
MTPTAEKLEDRHYTYADILQWDEGVRYELYAETAIKMAPTMRIHQEILGAIFYELYDFLKGKPCEVYAARFGVRLFPKEDNSDDFFFEPDIVVVCDLSKLDDRGCNGAPDLVVEILSPSTVKHDLLYKFNKYLEAGVREYWIVDPDEETLSAYILEGDRFVFSDYRGEAVVPSAVLPGFSLDLRSIFAAPANEAEPASESRS